MDGAERFRISSIEPNLITDEVIRFVAEFRVELIPALSYPFAEWK